MLAKPGPPRPRPPPGPAKPAPGPPKFDWGKAALRPVRSFSSVSEPLFSASHSANHFAKVSLNTTRVSEPSLLASVAVKRPGPMNIAGPKPPRPRPGSPGPPGSGPPPVLMLTAPDAHKDRVR